jgi:hypothetical protein
MEAGRVMSTPLCRDMFMRKRLCLNLKSWVNAELDKRCSDSIAEHLVGRRRDRDAAAQRVSEIGIGVEVRKICALNFVKVPHSPNANC